MSSRVEATAFHAKTPPLVRQALGGHRRDAVTHRDAVEGVRYRHGALLVRDDNQLRVSIGIIRFATKKGQQQKINEKTITNEDDLVRACTFEQVDKSVQQLPMRGTL